MRNHHHVFLEKLSLPSVAGWLDRDTCDCCNGVSDIDVHNTTFTTATTNMTMVTQLPSPSCFTTGTAYWSLIHCWFWYPEEASKTRPVLSTTSEDLNTFFIAPSICLARLTKLSSAYLANYFQLRFEITRLEVQRFSGYQFMFTLFKLLLSII